MSGAGADVVIVGLRRRADQLDRARKLARSQRLHSQLARQVAELRALADEIERVRNGIPPQADG